jgi:Zn-dependent protease
MTAETIGALTAAVLLLIISFPVHEAAHATTAWWLGDGHARALGRVSLDPRRHIDPIGAALLILSAISGGWMIGWAKPTPVLPQSLRGGALGLATVGLAGPISNLCLAIVVAGIYRVLEGPLLPDPIGWLLVYFTYYNVALLFLNLLPIPPFDGRTVLTGLLSLVSVRLADGVEGLSASRFAFPIMIAIMFFTPLGSFLGSLSFGLTDHLLGPE